MELKKYIYTFKTNCKISQCIYNLLLATSSHQLLWHWVVGEPVNPWAKCVVNPTFECLKPFLTLKGLLRLELREFLSDLGGSFGNLLFFLGSVTIDCFFSSLLSTQANLLTKNMKDNLTMCCENTFQKFFLLLRSPGVVK